jgi:Branched-chain amino acid transport protein (AzlD)
MSDPMGMGEGLIAVAGLTAITILTRGFFFLSEREIPFPPWLLQSLRYAPLAALVAVVAPGRARACTPPPPARPGSGGGAASWAPSSAAWRCCCPCGWAWAGEGRS